LEKRAQSLIDLRVRYDGAGPVYWNGGPRDFGLQDKSGILHRGEADPDGGLSFELSLEVKPGSSEAPVFVGLFAHGPPTRRFLYLSWRNREGEYAQRLKIPLGSIGWDEVRHARSSGEPLVCVLVDRHPQATSTGANIGGTRRVAWKVGTPNC
jgi:hypothetical protein